MKNSICFLRTPKHEKSLSFKFLIVLVFLFCFSFFLCFESQGAYAQENDFSYSYEYDANGRLIRVKDRTGKIVFEYKYDHLGNIISNGKQTTDSKDQNQPGGQNNSGDQNQPGGQNNSGNQNQPGNQNDTGEQNNSADEIGSGNSGDSPSSNRLNSKESSGTHADGGKSEKASENQSTDPQKKDSKVHHTDKSGDGQKTNKTKVDLTQYGDIKNHWAKDDIAFVLKRGYFVGTSSSSFSPSLEVDRAMIVTVLDRIEKSLISSNLETSSNEINSIVSSGSGDSNVFQDIQKGAYYEKSVSWAYSVRIIKGISPIRFAPTQKLTREQLAVILSNYLKFKKVQIQKHPSIKEQIEFKDRNTISSWAKEDVDLMVRLGILKGRTDGNFAAKAYVTRAEIAIVIKRLITLLES